MGTDEDRVKQLQEIDRQLAEALKFCATSGLSPSQISVCADPVVSWVDKKTREKRLRRLLKLAFLVAVLAFLWQNETSFRWLCVGCKLVQVKIILPYWDWTRLYATECVVRNPYYVAETISKDDCKWCLQQQDIPRLQNLLHDDMTNEYLLKHLPVVVTDAADGWIAREAFSLKYIQQLYQQEEVYKRCYSCECMNNVQAASLEEFLDNLLSYNNFIGYWFNCNFACMKAFRKYYRRPYFVPPMVGSSEQNFVVLGSNKGEPVVDQFQPFHTTELMTWFTQIKGQFSLVLQSQCGCPTLKITLKEGETLAFRNKIWWFSYAAEGEGEAIALGSGGSWD